MGQAIAITRQDHSAAELRQIAARHTDAQVVRRLLALALIRAGKSRTAAAAPSGMQRQTLRDWVHRYNAEGVAGLTSRVAPGAAPRLNETQMAALTSWVLTGPDPARDGVVRWRCVNLRAKVAKHFAVNVHERTLGKWLRPLGLTRLQPRPAHPRQDVAAQAAFKQTSPP